jgi:hypothetical protein
VSQDLEASAEWGCADNFLDPILAARAWEICVMPSQLSNREALEIRGWGWLVCGFLPMVSDESDEIGISGFLWKGRFMACVGLVCDLIRF